MNYIVLIASVVFYQISSAQKINFDYYSTSTDNDVSNNFINDFSEISPILYSDNNGITGGALIPPNSVSFGNDVLEYCSEYNNSLNKTIETSIAFKYNANQINPNSYQRTVAFFMEGNSNGHDIDFLIDKGSSLTISSYSYVEDSDIDLLDKHWHKMVATFTPIGGENEDEVFAKIEIYDIGIDGKNIPISLGSHSATIHDIDLINATKFNLKLSASKWAGAEYLDDFEFTGDKTEGDCGSKQTEILKSIITEEDSTTYPLEIEKVNFDNYGNDIYNNFTNKFPDSSPILFSDNNGISGGALIPPDQVDWGNDVLKYCSTYSNSLNKTIKTSMSFKYKSNLVNNEEYERTLAFFMLGNSNGHEIDFYINQGNSLTISSYGQNKSVGLILKDNNWHTMVASFTPLGGKFEDKVFSKVEVFDIGSDGKQDPVSLNSCADTIYDFDLVNSTEFSISISATKWGGAEYIDNFEFNGEKKERICGNNLNTDILKSNDFKIKNSNLFIEIIIDKIESNNYIELYYIDGKSKNKLLIKEKSTFLEKANLNTGVYIVILKGNNYALNKKLIIK